MGSLPRKKGHHEGISHAFAQSYDGESIQLGELKLMITEATIEEAKVFFY
jgi:hypothetical protein